MADTQVPRDAVCQHYHLIMRGRAFDDPPLFLLKLRNREIITEQAAVKEVAH